MAFYYVCGYDSMYSGLHGMKYDAIEEADSVEEALYTARELAWEVIFDFSCIYQEIEEEIEEECHYRNIQYLGEDYASEEEEQIREEKFEEDLEYYAIELNESKLPTKDSYELDEILIQMGSEEFVTAYGLFKKED